MAEISETNTKKTMKAKSERPIFVVVSFVFMTTYLITLIFILKYPLTPTTIFLTMFEIVIIIPLLIVSYSDPKVSVGEANDAVNKKIEYFKDVESQRLSMGENKSKSNEKNPLSSLVKSLFCTCCKPKVYISTGQRKQQVKVSVETKPHWNMVADTTTLMNKDSFKALQLLEGRKAMQLIIPRIVISELKSLSMKQQVRFFQRKTQAQTALEWIQHCMLHTSWWVHVQDSTNVENNLLDFAVGVKRNHNLPLALLSNDVTIKVESLAKGLMCEPVMVFTEILDHFQRDSSGLPALSELKPGLSVV